MSDFIHHIEQLSPRRRELLLRRLNSSKQNNTLSSIPPQSRNTYIFPLSLGQSGLWFLNQMEPESAFYNIFGAWQIVGPLDIDTMVRSINEVVGRHEILRTTFEFNGDQPMQAIALARNIPLPVVDVRSASDDEIARLIREEGQARFDLAHGPLLRVKLLQRAHKSFIFLMTIHHIIFDGWSIRTFLQELSEHYAAFLSARSPVLPTLPVQYADYATWQYKWLQGDEINNQLAYWKRQLQGIPPMLQLPTDYPRPTIECFRGDVQSLRLSSTLIQEIALLSQKEKVTQFTLLLAAFQILLYCYTRQDDVVVGVPVNNRRYAEIEHLIGYFVNTLVLRAHVSDRITFRAFLQQVSEVVVNALTHQDLPFEKLVTELNPNRNLSYNPLFQVMFNMQDQPFSFLQLTDVEIQPLEINIDSAPFDLSLEITKTEKDLIVSARYNTDIFEHITIRHMLEYYQVLLEAVVRNPTQLISTLPGLS